MSSGWSQVDRIFCCVGDAPSWQNFARARRGDKVLKGVRSLAPVLLTLQTRHLPSHDANFRWRQIDNLVRGSRALFIDAEGACDLVNVADAVDGELNADRTLVLLRDGAHCSRLAADLAAGECRGQWRAHAAREFTAGLSHLRPEPDPMKDNGP